MLLWSQMISKAVVKFLKHLSSLSLQIDEKTEKRV